MVSDMGGFVLPQVALSAAIAGDSGTKVLIPSGATAAGNLIIPEKQCRTRGQASARRGRPAPAAVLARRRAHGNRRGRRDSLGPAATAAGLSPVSRPSRRTPRRSPTMTTSRNRSSSSSLEPLESLESDFCGSEPFDRLGRVALARIVGRVEARALEVDRGANRPLRPERRRPCSPRGRPRTSTA